MRQCCEILAIYSTLCFSIIPDGYLTKELDPTVSDSYGKMMEVPHWNQSFRVEAIDTVEDHWFQAIKDLYMKNCEGFLLCYSSTKELPRSKIVELRDKILSIKELPAWEARHCIQHKCYANCRINVIEMTEVVLSSS